MSQPKRRPSDQKFKIPPSKISQARIWEKQLARELDMLEAMQPNALSAVRFHRFVP